jgi:16S rRNA (adenine1518-N6/adenine1519-N6)-dimethyltransferase
MPRTRKRYGQHFLEPAWADKVLQAIAPDQADRFLEIGPGAGILTLRLAPKVERLLAVEIDRDLAAALAPRLPANASIIVGDVLKVDLDAVLQSLAPGASARVAGNLPYNISSPILFRLLELGRTHRLVDATLMLQREVAERLLARPGTAEYGVLSVFVQWRAEVARLLALPPGAFRPPPAVRSSLVRLAFRPPITPVADEGVLVRMVRAMFAQRRKTLANALGPFGRESGRDPGAALHAAGIDPRRRPETLEIVEIARLADSFATAQG